jgi:hypothetical protein
MEEEIIYSNIQSKGCGTPCGWDCTLDSDGSGRATYHKIGDCGSCTCSCGGYIDGEECALGYDNGCNGTCL